MSIVTRWLSAGRVMNNPALPKASSARASGAPNGKESVVRRA